jgi:type IV secretory pathway TrbF-like protein
MSAPAPDTWQSQAAVLRTYQRLAAALAVAAALLATGLVVQSFRPAHVPYVVAVDTWGIPRRIEPLEPLTATHPRVLKAEIARFLHNLRAVVGDAGYQAELHRAAGAYLAADVRRRIEVWMTREAAAAPGQIAERHLRLLSILTRPDQTYLVRWEETSFGVAATHTATWEAVLAVEEAPALDEDEITLNPLGLRITSFDAVRLTEPDP